MAIDVYPKTRLWLERLAAGRVRLDDEQTHYLSHVRRLGVGDEVLLLGGDGQAARAAIVHGEPGALWLEVASPTPQPPPALELSIALATPKGERSDWAVEKLTELGVARIVWLATARGVVTPRQGGHREERWQRLALAAAQQAGRTRAPELCGPMPLCVALARPVELKLVADPSGEPLVTWLGRSLGGRAAAPRSAQVLIGPEGGFCADELMQAAQAGYTAVGLGGLILRVETAAVAAAAVLAGVAVPSASA